MRMINKVKRDWKVIYEVQVIKDADSLIKHETFEDKKEALGAMHEYALAVQKTGNFDTIKHLQGMYGYQIMNEGSICHYVAYMNSKVVKA